MFSEVVFMQTHSYLSNNALSNNAVSILERHSVPLGDRSVLSCPLDERATDIEWLRNGETYGQTAFLGYGIAQLEEATTSLNGTIFECFAVYDDETRPVAVKSWVVIVKGEVGTLHALW